MSMKFYIAFIGFMGWGAFQMIMGALEQMVRVAG